MAFDAGNYTVTVAGLVNGANATGTVEVKAQAATTLDLTNTVLTDNTAKAKLVLSLKDQYETALTIDPTEYTATAYNKTQNASVTLATDVSDSADKYFYIDTTQPNADAFKTDDVVSVTFMHKATGLKVTKDLKVVAGANLDTVTLGDIQLPTGKTLLTADLTDVKVPYTAKDQYGSDVDLVKDTNVTVISSDETVLSPADVTFIKDTDNTKKVKIAKFLKEGKATLTLLNKVTGTTNSVVFDVQKAPGTIASVQLAETTKTVAANSIAKIALTVTDKYGNAIAAKDYVTGKFNIVSSNPAVVANSNVDLKINNTAGTDDYGKLEVKVLNTAAKDATSTITITDQVTGVQYASLTVKAGEVAVPASIDIDPATTLVTTLIKGATTNVGYVVKDQYGNKWTSASDDYSVVYAIKDSGEAITEATGADADETAASAAITAAKEGSATLQAKLYYKKGDPAEKLVDTKETTFTVVANSSTSLTYSIADIPTLYQNANADGADDSITNDELKAIADLGYAKEVKVTAKDANGVAYQIPSSAIVNMTVTVPAGKEIAVQKETDSGKWYVVTSDNSATEDWKTTISVVLNADDTVKTLTKEVTVSKDAALAQSIAFKDVAPSVTKANDTATPAKDVDALTLPNIAAYTGDIADSKAYIWVADQFGGYGLSQTASVKLAPVDGVTGMDDDTVTLTSPSQDGELTLGGTLNNTVFTKDKATFRVIGTSGSQSDFITVTMTDGVLPTAIANADNAASFKIVNETTATIVFSEKLDAATFTDNDPNGFTVAEGTATLAKAELGADGKTVTLTGANFVAGTTTIAYTAGSVADVAGNGLADISSTATH